MPKRIAVFLFLSVLCAPQSAADGHACKDTGEHCAYWKQQGNCAEHSPHRHYMLIHCPETCGACQFHVSPIEGRCRRPEGAQPFILPSQLDAAFFHGHNYVSSPEAKEMGLTFTVWSKDPWIVTVDNLFNETEAKTIVAASKASHPFRKHWDRSEIVDERTSDYSYCTWECLRAVPALEKRIELLTGAPTTYTEFWEVLRYRQGQHYVEHHDFTDDHEQWSYGPRVFSFFMYLTDGFEEGETEFPNVPGADGVPLRIAPKLGRALWFANVRPGDGGADAAASFEADLRTRHAGLTVGAGGASKFVAALWMRAYDYRTPYTLGCARQQSPEPKDITPAYLDEDDAEL